MRRLACSGLCALAPIQPSPSAGVSANALNSVAAVAGSSAWTVGTYRGISRTLILHRN